MTAPILERDNRGAIAILTLNNPAKLNVLSDAMLAALASALNDIAHDPSVRVVVLRGSGKAFCAGHDLGEMTTARAQPDGGLSYFSGLFERCSRVMMALPKLPQPVIAAPHGIATAAGCQLVAACDMAIAASGTRFGVNGVNIGLFCSTPMVALTRNVARKRAFEMLVTGEFVDADEAQAIGLINRVVPAETHMEETLKLAEKVAGQLGKAVTIGKEAFYVQAELGLAAAYEYTGEIMSENMMLSDTKAGIDAFLDKRQPDWDQS